MRHFQQVPTDVSDQQLAFLLLQHPLFINQYADTILNSVLKVSRKAKTFDYPVLISSSHLIGEENTTHIAFAYVFRESTWHYFYNLINVGIVEEISVWVTEQYHLPFSGLYYAYIIVSQTVIPNNYKQIQCMSKLIMSKVYSHTTCICTLHTNDIFNSLCYISYNWHKSCK